MSSSAGDKRVHETNDVDENDDLGDIPTKIRRNDNLGRSVWKDVESPLLAAVKNDDEEAVEDLVAAGIDIDSFSKLGDEVFYSALHGAVKYRNARMVRLLLMLGAKPDVKPAGVDDSADEVYLFGTPADWAEILKHDEIGEILHEFQSSSVASALQVMTDNVRSKETILAKAIQMKVRSDALESKRRHAERELAAFKTSKCYKRYYKTDEEMAMLREDLNHIEKLVGEAVQSVGKGVSGIDGDTAINPPKCGRM